MEIIIFTGIQASGKSTFYKQNFFRTHVRISLDMLKTRIKEDTLLAACIKAKQSFVVDNTNPTAADRKKYIDMAKDAKCKVIGYYFLTHIESALQRNSKREGKDNIPMAALRKTYFKLLPPSLEEGFDELYIVNLCEEGSFIISKIV
ncbi:MAG: AAA family ATPase [Bacillota bacterium]|nr:AAA family ATPase [Bacillota bacterium]